MTSRLAIPLLELLLKSIYYEYVDLLANFSRTIAYNYVIDLRFVTIFGCKLDLGVGNELVVDVGLDKVDCATAKSATHDAASCNAIFLGDVIQVVELLARHFVVL